MNTSEDARDQYRIKKNLYQPVEKEPTQTLAEEKDPRDAYRIPSGASYENDDDLDRVVEKNIAGLTSRGIEQVVGFPGNMREFAKTVKDIYHIDPLYQKIKSLQKNETGLKKFEDENLSIIPLVGSIIDWFPTSSQLRQKSKELTGGFTEPTGEFSKVGHEIFEDVISSVLPGSGPRNIFRNLAIPVISNLSKSGAEYLGIEDKGQAATKFGITFFLNLMNRANAPKYNRDLWNNVVNTAPNISVTQRQNQNLLRQAEHLRDELSLGLTAPSESSALSAVNKFIDKLSRPNAPVTAKELVASNRSLNEITGDPSLLERGRTQLNNLRKTIHQGVEHIGQQAPDWVKSWKNANETHGAIANSHYVANYVSKNYTKPLVSEGARALFGAGPTATAIGATTAAPIFAIYKGIQVLNRVSQSPILRKYYTDAILATLRGNAALMTSNLEKLDKELAKKEKKIPYK